MSEKLYQVGGAAIRAPDGTFIKEAPIYRPITEEDEAAAKQTFEDFAAAAIKRMKAAAKRSGFK